MKLTKNRSTLLSSQLSGDKDSALPHDRSSHASSTVSPQASSGGSSGGVVLLYSHGAITSGSAVASGGAVVQNHYSMTSSGTIV